MQVQDDYLLRMIRRIAVALAAMLRGGPGDEASFDEAAMEAFGLTTAMMERMPVDRLVTTVRRARMPEGVALAMVGLRLKVSADTATGEVQQERRQRAVELLEAALELRGSVDGVDLREQVRQLRAGLIVRG